MREWIGGRGKLCYNRQVKENILLKLTSLGTPTVYIKSDVVTTRLEQVRKFQQGFSVASTHQEYHMLLLKNLNYVTD